MAQTKNNDIIQPFRNIPFDIGMEIGEKELNFIKKYLIENRYIIKEIPPLLKNLSTNIVIKAIIAKNVRLYIYSFGVGVFTIKDEYFVIKSPKYAIDYCEERKNAHNAFLTCKHILSSTMLEIMKGLRQAVLSKKCFPRKSACEKWENNGLSYVMTVSIIQQLNRKEYDFQNFDEIEKKNLLIMLEPSMVHKEDSLIISLDTNNTDMDIDLYNFDIDSMGTPENWIKSKKCAIYISWSAVVAYLNTKNDQYSEFLECMEVDLQAMWLYVYCLYYNLRYRPKKEKRLVSELKRELFLFQRMYNEFKSKNDTSMPEYVKRIRNELVKSSGIDEEQRKYVEYIKHCIDETESINLEK